MKFFRLIKTSEYGLKVDAIEWRPASPGENAETSREATAWCKGHPDRKVKVEIVNIEATRIGILEALQRYARLSSLKETGVVAGEAKVGESR
jgi:hypothetical protein